MLTIYQRTSDWQVAGEYRGAVSGKSGAWETLLALNDIVQFRRNDAIEGERLDPKSLIGRSEFRSQEAENSWFHGF